MTTTIIRDSIVGDNWIREAQAAVPIARKLGPDGNPTGDIILGPCRLAFTDSLTDPKVTDDFSVTVLFPPNADMTVLYEEYYAWCGREFPSHYDAGSGQYSGLHSPFHMQDEKLKYGGFTPGCVYINSGTQFRPPVVDIHFNPIVDTKNRVYAGVWAIPVVKPYVYGKAGKTEDGKPMKKGIGFGLQALMILGDDKRLGGGPPDAKKLYEGVNVSAPIARPDMANMPGQVAPPPAAGIPGYTAPGGGVPVPGQPQQGFNMPQTTYTPQPQGFTPQPPAVGYAPAPHAPGAAPNTTTSPSDEEAELRALGIIP